MAFTVQEYSDLIRLLREHPEWRLELRHLLLPEDYLELPAIARNLAEAQQRTEQALVRLAEAQQRTEECVEALAEAQRRGEERVARLEAAVERLAEAQARTEERVARLEAAVERLAEAQARTEERVARLEAAVERLAAAKARTEERVARLEAAVERLVAAVEALVEQVRELTRTQEWITNRLAGLRGRVLELDYERKAGAYFGPLLQRLRVVSPHTLEDELQAHLSREEFQEVLQLDLLLSGQPRYHPEKPEVWLAVEISAVVDREDVSRARRRAALLCQAGYRAIPVVAGEQVTLGGEEEVRQHNVVLFQDGRARFWEEALEAITAG